jgi:hypothetical protein
MTKLGKVPGYWKLVHHEGLDFAKLITVGTEVNIDMYVVSTRNNIRGAHARY